jgi:hypothetical protein
MPPFQHAYNLIMEPELKLKIDRYANNWFAAEFRRISDEANKKREQVHADLARRGVVNSGFGRRDLLQIDADRIKASVMAKAEGLISGYELNGMPLDDEIIKQVTDYYHTAKSAAANAMKSMVQGDIQRTGSNPRSAEHFINGIKQNLEIMTQGIMNEVVCLVEERKVVPKFKPQQIGHNITLNAGHNARVNLNSVDQSVNMVTITEQNVFNRIREIVASEIPAQDREEILKRIEAMESAVNKPTFREQYREWVAVAADHLALFQFCIPVLADMAHKHGLL